MYALIILALISSLISPAILALLSGRQARMSKHEDWERQDEVAKQAAATAQRLLEAQQETIKRTDEVARLQARDSAKTEAQLKAIHTLVNSDMTAARASQLVAVQALVAALRHIVTLDREAGREPSQDDLDAIEEGKAQIAELQAILADRLAQQRLVENQAEADNTD